MSAVRFRLEPPCKNPLIGVFICYNRIMKKTLIIGTMQTEWLEYVKELPKGNEDYEVLSSRLQLSGSALKAASLYQQFGFPYEVIAPVGRGSAGEMLSAYLEEKQIDVQHGAYTVHLLYWSIVKIARIVFMRQGLSLIFLITYF